MENVIIEWHTKEFEHYEKSSSWYLTLAIIIVLFLGYEILIKDYFAALTLAVIAAAVWFFSKQTPQDVHVIITDKGVMLNTLQLPFQNIKRFWIVDHDQARALHLETNAYLNHFIIIQMVDQDPTHVAEIMRRFVEESDPNYESVAHKIARKLKF